jgi:glycosyltransferase involved in cell wall biosynthesis
MTIQQKPNVSIGVPVYNGEQYLAATLESLLAQTYGDFELIISDNASIDHTEEICRFYAQRDRRIIYFRNPKNFGAPANFRRVFELASGQYFRWASWDDLFAAESLRRCVDILDAEPSVVLAYPKTTLIDAEGQKIDTYDDGLHLDSPKASERFVQVCENLKLINVVYGLARSDVMRKTQFTRSFPGGDSVLVAELSLYGSFWEIPEFLFYRRLHPRASSSLTESQLQEFINPASVGHPSFRHTRTFAAHFNSVLRAPIDNREKLFLVRYLLKRARWARWDLVEDMTSAMRQLRERLTMKA